MSNRSVGVEFKQALNRLKGFMLCSAVLAWAGSVGAAEFSLSFNGVFKNPTGGPGMVVSGVGSSSFTWGTALSGSSRSSLQFSGGTVSVDTGQFFALGTLTYHNGTVSAVSDADSVDLSITVTRGGITTEISKTLRLINTPNTADPEDSADKVAFPSLSRDLLFTVGGKRKRLTILGFGSVTGQGFFNLREFSTVEDETASAEVFATIRDDCTVGDKYTYEDGPLSNHKGLLPHWCPEDVTGSIPGVTLEDDEGNRIETVCEPGLGGAGEYHVFYVPANGNLRVLIGRCPYEEGTNSGVILTGGDRNEDKKPDCFIISRYISKGKFGYDGAPAGCRFIREYLYDFINDVRTVRTYTQCSPLALVAEYTELAPGATPSPLDLPPRLPQPGAMPSTTSPFAACDLNEDGRCDAADTALFNAALGSCLGQASYVFKADVDGDLCITPADAIVLTPPTVFGVTSPLNVSIVGQGKITPYTNGQRLKVSQGYRLTAKAKPGNVFSHWMVGMTVSTKPVLSFIMEPGLQIVAHFVPDPFPAVKGTYLGLFYNDSTVPFKHESSGGFTLTVRDGVRDGGTYSGSLRLAGKKYPISGRLALDRKGTNVIQKSIAGPLTVTWTTYPGDDGDSDILGKVHATAWEAELTADRAIFNARTNSAPDKGRYTLLVDGEFGDTNRPAGDGYGSVVVDGSGRITLAGVLAEGTPFAQRTSLTRYRKWPLYVPLYGGRGSVLSWITFDESPEEDFGGFLHWTRPPTNTTRYYPQGFQVRTHVGGSRYVSTNRVLNFTNGFVYFDEGNLPYSITNRIQFGDGNRLTNLSPNRLTFSFKPGNGLFSGTVWTPGTNQRIPFKGAVHQKSEFCGGFFLGTNQCGHVFIEGVP